MKARDIMVAPVITTSPLATIQEVAKLLLKNHISALPVIDDKGKIVGIIGEGDLLHRTENDTERRYPWWLRAITSADAYATEYVKTHTRKVSDVMTRGVVTASPETPLHEIAKLLEKHGIKRVPIVENGQLVGIVSRANLVQAVACSGERLQIPLSDTTIRSKLLSHISAQPWGSTALINVTVNDGMVDLWGVARSNTERKALLAAAETTPGVRTVNDNMRTWPLEA